jgi:hypothetical protein
LYPSSSSSSSSLLSLSIIAVIVVLRVNQYDGASDTSSKKNFALVQNVQIWPSCHTFLQGQNIPDGHEGCQEVVSCFNPVTHRYWINYQLVDGAVLINLAWFGWIGLLQSTTWKWRGGVLAGRKTTVWLSPCRLSLGAPGVWFRFVALWNQ